MSIFYTHLMKLANNIYLEVLTAHFYHAFFHLPQETLTCEGNTYISNGYRYPENFFQLAEFPNVSSNEEAMAHSKKGELQILAIKELYPTLEGVAEPLIAYHRFLGIRWLFKEIIIPHYDGSATINSYTYHFYKIGSVLRYLFIRDRMKGSRLFNTRLKTRSTKIIANMFPPAQTASQVKLSNQDRVETLEDMPTEAVQEHFTTRRQCLTVLHLLKANGIDITTVNHSTLAKIVHVMSAKELPKDANGQPKLSNSNIYKVLKNPYKVSNERNAEDIKFILSLFRPLATEQNTIINEVVKNLETDLNNWKL